MARWKMNSRTEPWNNAAPGTPPPFSVGDWVVPVSTSYPGWTTSEPRLIEDVTFEERSYNRGRWRYKIANPKAPNGYSHYNPGNFAKHEASKMGYQKTKYFAMKVDSQYDNGNGTSLSLVADSETALRDYVSQVKSDVEADIKEGEQWLVLQMHSLLEAQPPRPPIRVTEYK